MGGLLLICVEEEEELGKLCHADLLYALFVIPHVTPLNISMQYNKRFVNVTLTGGKRRMNPK